MKKRALILFSVLVFIFAFATAGMSATFRQVVTFGDSLTDSGNIIRATAAQSGGQLVEGKVWAEHLADFLDASLMNFAHAGARCGDNETPPFGLCKQVADFLAAFSNYPSFDYKNSMFAIWIGGNDMLDAMTGADPTTLIGTSIQSISSAMNNLADAGIQNLLVFNLPDLGLTPKANTDAVVAAMARQLSQAFNAALADALTQFSTQHPSVNLYTVDVFTIMDGMVADPATYGFDNVTDALVTDIMESLVTDLGTYSLENLYDALANGELSIAGDLSLKYLFLDEIHPTSAGHAVIAGFAAQAISGTGPAWYGSDGVLHLPNFSMGQSSFNCTMEMVAPAPDGVDGFVFHTTSLGAN